MSETVELYRQRVARLHRELGIPVDYAARCGLSLQHECSDLVATEPDAFGRQPQLERGAFAAWCRLREAAAEAGIDLLIVSAYRSVDYQHGLIHRKLQRGLSIESILEVNAAPGYSEHHSGRALDIGSQEAEHLSEAFETTAAFAWLSARAADFGFRLSFPRGNPFGVLYEPWHWYWWGEGNSDDSNTTTAP